jgi:hypothetical protein
MIASCISKSLQQWDIPSSKLLLIVSDNGSNVVKAVKLIASAYENEDSTDSGEETDSEGNAADGINDVEEEDHFNEVVESFCWRHMPCLAHSLQLVVKFAYSKDSVYNDVVKKARNIVGSFKRSSILTEKLISQCNKGMITDCPTRWNSTYMMIQRLLELKQTVNCLMEEASMDTLVTTEWKKLDEMQNLLGPFKQHTDALQTDCLSLSNILPSLDLECHLQDFKSASNKAFITVMLKAFQDRFSMFLDPEKEKFNALPAAACLLDPTVAAVLLSPDNRDLLESAKRCIISLVSIRCLLLLQKDRINIACCKWK